MDSYPARSPGPTASYESMGATMVTLSDVTISDEGKGTTSSPEGRASTIHEMDLSVFSAQAGVVLVILDALPARTTTMRCWTKISRKKVRVGILFMSCLCVEQLFFAGNEKQGGRPALFSVGKKCWVTRRFAAAAAAWAAMGAYGYL